MIGKEAHRPASPMKVSKLIADPKKVKGLEKEWGKLKNNS